MKAVAKKSEVCLEGVVLWASYNSIPRPIMKVQLILSMIKTTPVNIPNVLDSLKKIYLHIGRFFYFLTGRLIFPPLNYLLPLHLVITTA